ncbi:MAG TPA: hypothetical protein VF773_15975 [Verrucomicrobiae bacterium]
MSMYRGTPLHKRHFRPAMHPDVWARIQRSRQEREEKAKAESRAQIRADIEAAKAKATVH